MRSSYIENDFGGTLTEYVRSWQPCNYVELGVLDGYSTLAIAKGMAFLEKHRGTSNLKMHAYDLFDDYQYKHGNKEEVKKLLEENNVSQYVDLIKGDAFKVHENYPDTVFSWEQEGGGRDRVRGIEFLHIDISNNGDNIRELMKLWHPKVAERGLVLIEGGSQERDEVEWMVKYNMASLKKEIETNEIINTYYDYMTYFNFPGLTVLLRKWHPINEEELKWKR